MSLRSALHWLTTCASHHLPTGRKEIKILQKFGVCPKISVQDKKIEKLFFQRDSVISFFSDGASTSDHDKKIGSNFSS